MPGALARSGAVGLRAVTVSSDGQGQTGVPCRTLTHSLSPLMENDRQVSPAGHSLTHFALFFISSTPVLHFFFLHLRRFIPAGKGKRGREARRRRASEQRKEQYYTFKTKKIYQTQNKVFF